MLRQQSIVLSLLACYLHPIAVKLVGHPRKSPHDIQSKVDRIELNMCQGMNKYRTALWGMHTTRQKLGGRDQIQSRATRGLCARFLATAQIGIAINHGGGIYLRNPGSFFIPGNRLQRNEGNLSSFVHRSLFRDLALLVIW